MPTEKNHDTTKAGTTAPAAPAAHPATAHAENPQETLQAAFPDRQKIAEKIKQRKEMLESIKEFIPLKTYHLIEEKLEYEKQKIENKVSVKERDLLAQSLPQKLPKGLFEQRHLRLKSIRID